MKIIVLSITPYKEKDAIIDALSENGDFTFLAKGIYNPKSKNAGLNNILVTADIETNEGNYKYPVLKTADIIDSPMKVTNDFYYLSSIMMIAEATKLLLQDEEKVQIFSTLATAIHLLKAVEQPWEILLAYMANLLKVGGYDFEVNKCVLCGTKHEILTFSFNDGGFVCKKCFEEDMVNDLTVDQMWLIRSAFNTRDLSKISFKANKEDALKVLSKFLEFIKDSYGVTLKSAALIYK